MSLVRIQNDYRILNVIKRGEEIRSETVEDYITPFSERKIIQLIM